MNESARRGPAALLRSTPVRFILAGLLNTAAGLSVSYFALHACGLPYWPATFLGFAAGWAVGFGLSRRLVFQSRLPCRTALPRYALVVVSAYGLAAAPARQAAGLFAHAVPSVAEAAAPHGDDFAVLLCNALYAVLNYAGQRWFVFRR